MNTVAELEALRNRIIQEINAEFDRLIEQAETEHAQVPEGTPMVYERTYPLTVGSQVFKGAKPIGVLFGDGTRVDARTWKQVVEEVMKDCIASRNNKAALQSLCGKVTGKKRTLLAAEPKDMRSPLELSPGLYLETHYDTQTLLNILTTRILDAIHYDYSGISVVIRNH